MAEGPKLPGRRLERLAGFRTWGVGLGLVGVGISCVLWALDALDTEMPDWVLIGVLIFGIVLVLLGIGLPTYATYAGRHRLEELPESQLAYECRETVKEIERFLEVESATDPSRTPHWHGVPDNASEGEKRRAIERHTQALLDHSGRMMRSFDSQFGVRVLWLYDELARRGLTVGMDRLEFEHPTNPLGIRRIMQQLGTACERLRQGT